MSGVLPTGTNFNDFNGRHTKIWALGMVIFLPELQI